MGIFAFLDFPTLIMLLGLLLGIELISGRFLGIFKALGAAIKNSKNLDDETKRMALEAFKTILDNNPMITAIIISHNDGFDELCDRHIEVINHEFIERV